MHIKDILQRFSFPVCEKCHRNCKGRLDYNNLCSNYNYIKEYGERNYQKNKESFVALKEKINLPFYNIFSFGCGLGFDFVAATEIFGENIKYFGIDECDWAIKNTSNYKNFRPKLPKTISLEDGLFLLNAIQENSILCFFNSLFTISNTSEFFFESIVESLNNKKKFLYCL